MPIEPMPDSCASCATPVAASAPWLPWASACRGMLAAATLLVAAGCAAPGPGMPSPVARPDQPEAATGFAAPGVVVTARRFMAVTAHPLATRAAHEVLERGGSAVDAAVAAQMVLTLVEPQSSGIGGGAFLLAHDAASGSVTAWDGRETAPAAADEALFRQPDGRPMPFHAAAVGGRAVGVPGTVAMLQAAHARHGRLPWAQLMQPAIAMAESGAPVGERLHALLAGERFLREADATAAAHFHDAAGRPWPVGHRLRNPELADTLREIAARGARALLEGPIAADIVAKVRGHRANPGRLEAADLAAYRPRERAPVCGPYLAFVVCGMPPPSSGGIAVLQILAMLEARDLVGPPQALADEGGYLADGAHRLLEASRLAHADRDRFVADPDFVPWPPALLAPRYLRERARLIDDARAAGVARPGNPEAPADAASWQQAAPSADAEGSAGAVATAGYEERGTTHLSIVDAWGNAVALTGTIEDQFGSRLMVRGFLLNNQLTDFSFAAHDGDGPVANRVEPGKRPRSSMSPTLVFERRADGSRGALAMAIGSPGGGAIIGYVARVLVATLRDGIELQAAIELPNLGNRNGPTDLERGRAPAALADALSARGHRVREIDMTSGLHGILVRRDADGRVTLVGGVDPRREGAASGR